MDWTQSPQANPMAPPSVSMGINSPPGAPEAAARPVLKNSTRNPANACVTPVSLEPITWNSSSRLWKLDGKAA